MPNNLMQQSYSEWLRAYVRKSTPFWVPGICEVRTIFERMSSLIKCQQMSICFDQLWKTGLLDSAMGLVLSECMWIGLFRDMSLLVCLVPTSILSIFPLHWGIRLGLILLLFPVFHFLFYLGNFWGPRIPLCSLSVFCWCIIGDPFVLGLHVSFETFYQFVCLASFFFCYFDGIFFDVFLDFFSI